MTHSCARASAEPLIPINNAPLKLARPAVGSIKLAAAVHAHAVEHKKHTNAHTAKPGEIATYSKKQWASMDRFWLLEQTVAYRYFDPMFFPLSLLLSD